jgi:transcriptional regulator with XRE-family HTH domain
MATYRYTECGLDNVVIHGMSIIKDDAGNEVYELPNVNGLHKVIAHAIVTTGHGLTPNELRFLRTEMGMTQSELAVLVKKDHQTVGRWERGEVPIDPNAEVVIRLHAAEKLDLNLSESVETVAARAIPSGEFRRIDIDGRNPRHYRLKAA